MTVRHSAVGQDSNLTGQIGKSVLRRCRIKPDDIATEPAGKGRIRRPKRTTRTALLGRLATSCNRGNEGKTKPYRVDDRFYAGSPNCAADFILGRSEGAGNGALLHRYDI